MSVANGREFLNIPGPTNVPDAVLAAMHRPAIDIYSGDMLGLTHSLFEDLPKIFRTAGRAYIYAANGHGGWEAALTNVLSRGDTILVLESGLFAAAWGEMAHDDGDEGRVAEGRPAPRGECRGRPPAAGGRRQPRDHEMGLAALGIPHGAGGVQRAVEYLGREVRA